MIALRFAGLCLVVSCAAANPFVPDLGLEYLQPQGMPNPFSNFSFVDCGCGPVSLTMPMQTWAGAPAFTPPAMANTLDPVYDETRAAYQPAPTYSTYNGASQSSLFSSSMNSETIMPSPYSLASWTGAGSYQGLSNTTWTTSGADQWIAYTGAPDLSLYINPIIQNPVTVTYAPSPVNFNYAGFDRFDPTADNPEPSTAFLIAGGAAVLVWARRRLQNSRS